MNDPKNYRYSVDTVDSVLRMLCQKHNREQLVTRLFPGDGLGKEAYRDEWRNRDPFAFWVHLDKANQVRLIQIARQHYAEMGCYD